MTEERHGFPGALRAWGGVGSHVGAPHVIVGAGMLGAAAAYHLTRAGRRVVVLEGVVPASGASSNSFAWVNAVHKEPDAYHRLNAAGVREYPRVAQELGADSGYRSGGSLEWAAPDRRAELEARVARLAGRGYESSFVSREQARAMEPGLAIPDDVPVAFFEPDGWVDAPRLVASFLDRAQRAGAEVRTETMVRDLRAAGGRVETVVTSRDEVQAATVLLCAGVGTSALVSSLGVRVPVRRVPGILAVTSPPSAPLGHVVHAPGIHLRPEPSGGVLLGATDVDEQVREMVGDTPREWLTPEARARAVKPLLDRARPVFPPLRDARVVTVRIGVRPMPEDGHTIAGPLPGLANAWVIVTHSAITMGPLLGRLIAAEMMGAAPHDLLAPFRPSRFASTAMRR